MSSDFPLFDRPAPVLFLDRDGVVNYDKGFVHRIQDFECVHGVLDLVRAARADGFRIAVITNQSGIARGMYGHAEAEALHAHMREIFHQAGAGIDLILYCPHLPELGECLCRKPRPLLFQRAAYLLNADLSRSLAIGDRERDLTPARMLGCRTWLFTGDRLPEWGQFS